MPLRSSFSSLTRSISYNSTLIILLYSATNLPPPAYQLSELFSLELVFQIETVLSLPCDNPLRFLNRFDIILLEYLSTYSGI